MSFRAEGRLEIVFSSLNSTLQPFPDNHLLSIQVTNSTHHHVLSLGEGGGHLFSQEPRKIFSIFPREAVFFKEVRSKF